MPVRKRLAGRPSRHLADVLVALSGAVLVNLATAAGIAWQDPLDLARGPGERGPWQQNESRYRYVDDGTVAIGPDGVVLTAWVDQAAKDVVFQAADHDGGLRGAPLNLSGNGATFSWLPRIALAPDRPGLVIVLWQEIIFRGGSHGGDILLARSTDGGASFSAPVNLSESAGGDGKGRITRDIWHNGSLDVVIGRDGAVHVAWTEYDGQLWYRRSRDGGASFAPPRQVAGSKARPARAPSLALSDHGALYLAWTVGEDRAADILLARSTDGGDSFTSARTVQRNSTYSDAPKVAVDADGIVHLAWAESAGGPFERYRIRYARSLDRGYRFSQPTWLGDPQAGAQSAAFPYLAVDRRGTVMVMWELFPRVSGRSRGLAYTVSTNGGSNFDQASLVPQSVDQEGRWNGSFQGLLMQKLALDNHGRVAVINSAMKDGHSSRVWLMRGKMQ